jgi:hypothetical protein
MSKSIQDILYIKQRRGSEKSSITIQLLFLYKILTKLFSITKHLSIGIPAFLQSV